MSRQFIEPFPSASTIVGTPEISDYVYRSFYFSQGAKTLQTDILSYGYAYYNDNILTMTNPEEERIVNDALKRTGRWIQAGPHSLKARGTSEQATKNELEIATHKLIRLAGMKPVNKQLDEQTAQRIVRRDYKWLVTEPGGRPGRHPEIGGDINDPYLSHGIHHGLLSNTTHHPVYDAMFKRVGSAMLSLYREDSPERNVLYRGSTVEETYRTYLQGVLDIFIDHHPQSTAAIAELLLNSDDGKEDHN